MRSYRLLSYVQMDATTPNIFGPTMRAFARSLKLDRFQTLRNNSRTFLKERRIFPQNASCSRANYT